MHQGVFLVIEASDGSGQGTQFKLIVERLKSEGYDVASYDFPQYEADSSYFVRQYLNGKYGTAEELGPYVPSLFYALDRFDAAQAIAKDLAAGKLVISNRFVGSNMAHQGGKLATKAERSQLFQWLEQLEFGLLNLPRPDLNLVLLVPAEAAQHLVGKKATRRYTDQSHDIHEADLQHLEQAVAAFGQLCEDYPDQFALIDCTKDGQLRSIPAVNNLIWERIQPMLNKLRRNKPSSAVAPQPATAEVPKEYSLPATSLLLAGDSGYSLTSEGFKRLTKLERSKFYTPNSLDEEATQYYRQQMKNLFDNAGVLLKQLHENGVSETVATRIVAAVLPLASQAELGSTLNSNQPVITSFQAEAEQLGLQTGGSHAIQELEAIAVERNLQPIKGDQEQPVVLVDYWPRNELQLLPQLLYPFSSVSFRQLTQEVDRWSYQEKETILQAALQNTPAVPSLEASYSFELLTSYRTFLQLPGEVRSRVLRQHISPHYGFTTPEAVSQAGLDELYEQSFEISRNLYQYLLERGHQIDCQYAALLGHKLAWHLNLSLAELILLLNEPVHKVLTAKLLNAILKVHPLISKSCKSKK